MNNQKILIQRWKTTRTKLGEYLKKYQKLNKKTQDNIQSVLNSVNIKPLDLNKTISHNEKNRLNRKIAEWEELGLLVGYFAYKVNEIISKNHITYNDMLEILIYGSFIEERKTLDEYDKILFKSIATSLYTQGIKDINLKENKKWSLTDDALASFLLTPIDGVLWNEYIQALALTNSQEIKKIAVNNIFQEINNEVEDNVYQKTFQKQRNRLISITDNGISGRLDLQATVIGNMSYLQAGIDTNTRYVRFVSDLCEHVTKMCANMDGIIFDIKGDNKFHRWYGQDSKSLKYEEIECFGLVPGINLPPIFHHFHWCHSTLTYQTQLSADKIRKLMNNGNIRDKQPIDSFVGKNKKTVNTITPKEAEAIKNYTGIDAQKINRAIRRNEISENIQEKINILDSAIQKAPALKEEMTVYRGTIPQSFSIFKNMNKITDEEMLNLVGKVQNDPAFMSTSSTMPETLGRNVIMTIKLPKGYKGALPIKEYALPKYKYQNEVLLKKDNKFLVKSVIIKDNKYYLEVEML